MSEKAPPKPKPAPPTRYGPTFDEIDRKDPVQWWTAHEAWVKERLVEMEMINIYRDRVRICYMREQVNFPVKCRKDILNYWNSYQAWKKKGKQIIIALPFIAIPYKAGNSHYNFYKAY